LDFFAIIRFLLVLQIFELIIWAAPWAYTLKWASFATGIPGILIVEILTNLLPTLVTAGGLCFIAMATLAKRPQNLRLFFVRFILIALAVSFVGMLYGFLHHATTLASPGWVAFILVNTDGMFTLLTMSFLYYFVIVSFFNDTCPVRLPGV
jgi:hypothetical protein